jgi:serine/threonine protein kinase
MNCLNCGNTLRPDTRFCPSCGTAVNPGQSTPAQEDPRIQALEDALGRKYRIVKKVGSGGFADVYLGEHMQLGRLVAIKILARGRSEDEDMVERFRRESKAAAKLSHPNIIDIYDVGESGEIYYFVMKYISGETLAHKMRREKKVDPAEAIDIVIQIADALAYAHEHNVVHRDIKPANVMLDEYGKPVLMDFGIARVQFGGQLTRTGALIGTPHYLPPEQPLGKTVDGRSDIYSLGIMFYEMLAGRVPFHDEAAITLIYKHINEPPPPLQELAPELPPDLCAVVHKMIEKLPENRYQSAEDLIEALDKFSSMYGLRSTPSAARRSTPSGRRSTEKIFLLARQHVEENKLEQALDMYKSILQRHPDHVEAKKRIEELVTQIAEVALKQIQEKKFVEANETITRLERNSPNDPVITGLRYDLEHKEQRERKDSEFRSHYEAASLALKHDHASRAVEHLTKALTINPESPEATELLRQARTAYEENRRKAEFANAFSEAEYYHNTGSYDQALAAIKRALEFKKEPSAIELEAKIRQAIKEKAYKEGEEQRVNESVEHLCESLDFDGALEILRESESVIPDVVKNRMPAVTRNRDLYQEYRQAEEQFSEGRWEEAVHRYGSFLRVTPPYDYQAFYRLRKEAEEKLKQSKTRLEEAQIAQLLKKADVLLRMGQTEEAITILENLQHPDAQAKLKQVKEAQKRATQTPDVKDIREVLEADTSKFAKTVLVTEEKTKPIAPVTATTAATQAPPVALPRPAVRPSIPMPAKKGVPTYLVVGGLATVFVFIIAAVLFFWNPSEPKTSDVNVTPPPRHKQPRIVTSAPTMPVTLDSIPWAEIEISGGSLKETVRETTPCRVSLPAGEYNITLKNPELAALKQTIRVSNNNRDFRFQFPDVSPEKLAATAEK